MTQPVTVKFISLGCAKNLVDSEIMQGLLARENFKMVSETASADVGVVNTCGFIEASKQESINTILTLAKEKKEKGLKLLVVAGCLSQRYKEELPKLIPEVDAFIGTGDFQGLNKVIREKLAGEKRKNFIQAPSRQLPQMDLPRVHSTPFYTRYVKISEGCSHTCSFCTIPMMRGGLQSRTPADVLGEIKSGVSEGVKEFNLIAQDLNEYGRDLGERSSLYKLLEDMAPLDGNFWVRLLYMYPLQFPDKLIGLIKNHPHIIPYVDIPLQHINDRILKSMNRGSSARYIYRLLENLKKEIPDIVLRTTFIVGYPGETDAEFGDLLKFVREMEFDRLGAFTYSVEENTPAAEIEAQLPPEVKNERRDILMEAQQAVSLSKNQRLVGRTLPVLFERKATPEEHLVDKRIQGVGRYFGQAPEIDGETYITLKDGTTLPKPGDFVDVKMTNALEYDLIGETT